MLDWFEKHKRKMKIIVVLCSLLIASTAATTWYFWETPMLSPITSSTRFRFLREPSTQNTAKKVIYGFLPYWNQSSVTLQKELTHLGYFSLTIKADGTFLESLPDGTREMGLHRLNSEQMLDVIDEAQQQGTAVEVVITQFNHGDITAFLSSKKAQESFFAALDSVLLAYPISGVNIDFETSGSTNQKMRDDLTSFMKDLRAHLDGRYSNITLSIDTYASAAQNPQLWDIPALAEHIDYIVVMAYDFHRSSSANAGPVAPLFGGKELWEGDINNYLQAFLATVPPEKILLGIPFYGYEWQTTSRDSRSHTFPNTGSTASYKRVQGLLENSRQTLQVEEHWNEEALSPYISYIEDGEIYVIYYENSRSISYKLDYVNQLNLGGIAIWALGYEGNSRELWDVIERKFVTKSQ